MVAGGASLSATAVAVAACGFCRSNRTTFCALGGVIIYCCPIGLGGYFVAADTLGRTVIAPTELPVGLIMALGGAPFFISILRRRGLNG